MRLQWHESCSKTLSPARLRIEAGEWTWTDLVHRRVQPHHRIVGDTADAVVLATGMLSADSLEDGRQYHPMISSADRAMWMSFDVMV